MSAPKSNAEEIVDLKHRIRLMSRGYFVLGLVTLIALAGVVKLAVSQSDTTREGLSSRVKTIEQRCDLTHKIEQVLVKDDPVRVASFKISWQHCEAQLGEVRAILRKAGGKV